MGETAGKEHGIVTRSAEYIGSFPVDDGCLDDQIQQLHTQLKSFKYCKSKRMVSLRFSIKGVKVYDEDEMTLLMAHAMCRVSLSTSHPSDAQFAFVSHNPGNSDAQLYCHLFRARHARAAQFLNLLLCRCFQLYFLEKHPEEAQDECSGKKPTRTPSLLNQGFPLSVSALVSFRRAPTQGLLPGAKVFSQPSTEQVSSPEEGPTSSPTLVRKRAIRTKELRSGAYRSFTFTPLKQRHLQDKLSAPQEKEQANAKACKSPSLAETEEALAQAVWCWAGVSSDCSSSLLADDVLGAFLLCPHPKKPSRGCLIVRFPSGLVTHAIKNSKGKFRLEKCHIDFESLAALIEYYTEFSEELECSLSCARVNHCYDWEEIVNKSSRSLQDNKKGTFQNQSWV
ncbi:SH2 domain-containing protein 5-like [Sinocyclocheilus rhinocerous]|uniref:SH2 domain-containing protein 5-like n=1 Tax=Sinocyclocheilus rhinocerous TaxID=307959 RepID=A0A673FI29_9TELE|nr:PREDICTED: SH2 domain-containing protein 5-like [Sinocyclocheilus rhinocerous]XP_016422405.1 PREDICTED: SH2 domain-containing protein 5-like [Sinocyclocheilus rhinocerous]XP_016422406.1 PREDICTED: SH2 domain-containing protein 5-like [Sinocyclocheilus rhinocerous]XP_016422407.1 PREDICTED: SH2 domain-containing protein 5-like [Sinocyclocheilus rhinocerous]XP_016422408.1 PREDICTED: SH2 domain-containing protein 5-like [Sinocyclocheilus rhinocerous]XP_016422409.1 PREDICTED: SH2 domain-containi